MKFRLVTVVAAFLVLAFRVCAQGGVREPAGSVGQETIGTEPARPAVPVTPFSTPEKRPKGPTEITAREAMFDSRIHLGTFTGEVVVRDPEFGLSSDSLTVNMKKPLADGAEKPAPKPKTPGESSSGIEKAVAEGNVVITQEKPDADGKMQRYTGKAKRAVFDNTTGTLTLSGWPQISQTIGGSLSKQILSREESCVITLNRAGKIDVKGYHTSTLQDAGDLNAGPR